MHHQYHHSHDILHITKPDHETDHREEVMVIIDLVMGDEDRENQVHVVIGSRNENRLFDDSVMSCLWM